MDHQTRVTVSGSFHRHLEAIQSCVNELRARGVEVLSPAEPTVVDHFGDFLFVASDRLRSVRAIQSRHLVSIEESDLLVLVCPDGYVGASAAMEVGYAVRCGTRIASIGAPNDLTLRQYVNVAGSVADALALARYDDPLRTSALILDPVAATGRLHAVTDQISNELLLPVGRASESRLLGAYREARDLLRLP